MTASSPYAPIRRQSSSGHALRRSSSIESAVSSGARGTIFWILIRFWRQAVSDSDATRDSIIRTTLNGLAETVRNNLTLCDESQHKQQDNKSGVARRRHLSTVLRWVITIIGGDKSRLGKVALIMIGFVREVLLRSIGAANSIFTGVPIQIITRGDIGSSSIPIVNGKVALDTTLINNGMVTTECKDIDVIRRDRQQIDQVLTYWFVEMLEEVDADIAGKFRTLIWDLSSSSITIDNSQTLDKEKLQRWTEDGEVFGWQVKVAAIIALDQLNRHIHRHDKGTKSAHIPEQRLLDNIACNVSIQLQKQHEKEISTGIIPIPMRILPPLRHALNVSDYSIVQNDIESSALLHEEMDRMIRRFRKAKNHSMAGLQDKASKEGKLGIQVEDDGIDTFLCVCTTCLL